jgi:ubiquinone/menaquinone biosynthesis C-methylase UbiE
VDIDIGSMLQSVPGLSKERVLDFGCGVGRLSQGLAKHFRHVDGVDIAKPMIELAQQHNQHGDRVRYHLNSQRDLRLFPNDHFDLIYSVITLQHIPAPLIPDYLQEFARVCRPGGLIFFQLPSSVPTSKFRFSWYPPTLWKRLKRVFLKTTAIRAEMSMNCLKKSEILAIFARLETNPIKIEPYAATGKHESWSYLFQKGSGREL